MEAKWKKQAVIFILSQNISLFGSLLVQYAITWFITLQTHSGVMMTISIICGFLPTFFISPFGGVWADRYDRKKLIILADAMIAVATLILALLFLAGYNAIWLLFVISAIRAIGGGIQSPAESAFIPQLVPTKHLTRVSGINTSLQSFQMLLAPMLSGALLTFASIEVIFFIDVITAALAIVVLMFFLHVPLHHKAAMEQKESYFSDMGKGIGYIRNHLFLKEFFLFCMVYFIFCSPVAFLTPLQVSRSFGSDVWRLTAIEITYSVGMVLGGAFIGYWAGFKNKIVTMAVASILLGLFTISFGLIPYFWLYLTTMSVFGFVMPFFNTPAFVLLQEKVEEDYMGRVFGVLNMIVSLMMPLGMLVFGPLADIVRIEWILIATGFCLLAEGVLLWRNRLLRMAGELGTDSDTQE